MTLERAIAVLFLGVCVAYGYTAFVTMQNELLPFELGMPFLPNTLPKVLSVTGVVVALAVIFGSGTPSKIDVSKFERTHVAQAIGLLAAMVAYALLLRPLGFIPSTSLFLTGTALILGERRFHLLIPIALIAAFTVWYLVEEVLDIVLSPWPTVFIGQ